MITLLLSKYSGMNELDMVFPSRGKDAQTLCATLLLRR